MEIGKDVTGVDSQALEEKNSSRKRKLHASQFPFVIVHLGLLHQKMSAAIEVAKDAPSECNLPLQGSVNLGNSVGRGVDQDVATHPGKHLFFVGRWVVARIRAKFQAHQCDAGLAYAG